MSVTEVLPAHAGMIPATRSRPTCLTGAPRACGDDPMQAAVTDGLMQCSPRMRG